MVVGDDAFVALNDQIIFEKNEQEFDLHCDCGDLRSENCKLRAC